MTGKSMGLNIQLFAEGGSGEGSGVSATVARSQSGEGSVSAGNVPDAGEQSGADNSSGKDSTSSTASGPPSPQGEGDVTLDSLWEKHPELKKENDKRTQKAIQSRLYQQNKSMKPINDIIDKMMVLHGVKNVDELSAKLEKILPQEFSMNRGIDGDVGQELFDMQVGKMQEARMREYYEKQAKAQQQVQAWQKEAEEVKAVYPEFKLEDELENADFVRLISASDERYRMPMKQIYEMIHHDELMKAAEKRAADAYSKSVNVNKQRPPENGTGNQSPVSGNLDVSKLTKKERAELIKRAQRGEIITL